MILHVIRILASIKILIIIINYQMTDKTKYFYVPQNYNENRAMRNYTTTNIPSNSRTGLVSQPNSSLTSENISHQKQQNPIGSTFGAGQYSKNFGSNISQFQDRIQHLTTGYKRQEATVFSNMRGGDSAFELRSSVPVNHTKKPEMEFLRNTTFTPKPKGMLYGQYNYEGEVHANTETYESKSTVESCSYSFKFDRTIKKDEEPKDRKNDKFVRQMKLGISDTKQPLPYSPPSTNIIPISKPEQTYLADDKKNIKGKNMVNGFYIGKSLGCGRFAEVFLAKDAVTGFVCVLKRLNKQKIKDYKLQSQVTQEIKIHAFLNHPNIVQFYGVFHDKNYIYMILEYLESGTLFDYLGDKSYCDEKEAVLFMRQICMAVKYLHNKDIAHRDIKPQNIIISYGLAKLCDFGWSARVNGARSTYCGTFDYVPPEILEKKQYDQTVDLWCIGILTYELLTNKVPFQAKQRNAKVTKIMNVDRDKISYPENVSAKARDFIDSLIRKNPEQRLKAKKLLEHPFLKQYEDES